MRIISLILLIIYSYSVDAQDDRSDFLKKSFQSKSGLSLPYRIISNQKPGSEKRPLLVFLHGAGERGNDNEKQLVHGTSFIQEAVEKHNAVVIVPQCRQESYWSSVEVNGASRPINLEFNYNDKSITPDLLAVVELVKEIKKTHKIDRKRIYIMGLSMGGMGTFEIVNHYPKCFAAAVPICGGGDVLNYTPKARKVPFWVFHGDADMVVDVNESRKMVAKLKDLQYDINYTEYPGINHNSWDNAFKEPGLSDWIFSQKR